MSMLPDEFRIAARALRRSPGFTAVAVASLGLAIGVNTAVFGVVDAALFAPLPLAGAECIVRLWEERPSRGWLRFGVSAPTFRDWQERMASLAHVAAYAQRSANLAGSDRPERVRLVESTADLFAVLDVRPKLGRFFTRDEELPGRDTHDHRLRRPRRAAAARPHHHRAGPGDASLRAGLPSGSLLPGGRDYAVPESLKERRSPRRPGTV